MPPYNPEFGSRATPRDQQQNAQTAARARDRNAGSPRAGYGLQGENRGRPEQGGTRPVQDQAHGQDQTNAQRHYPVQGGSSTDRGQSTRGQSTGTLREQIWQRSGQQSTARREGSGGMSTTRAGSRGGATETGLVRNSGDGPDRSRQPVFRFGERYGQSAAHSARTWSVPRRSNIDEHGTFHLLQGFTREHRGHAASRDDKRRNRPTDHH
jgi:hypothetical protein